MQSLECAGSLLSETEAQRHAELAHACLLPAPRLLCCQLQHYVQLYLSELQWSCAGAKGVGELPAPAGL